MTMKLNYKTNLIFNTLEIYGLGHNSNSFLLSSILDQLGHGSQAKTVHLISAPRNIMTIQLQILFKILFFSRKSSTELVQLLEML